MHKPNKESFSYSAWIARSYTGLLIIASTMPELITGYWLAPDARPFPDQTAFPNIKYEDGPRKVNITLELDKDEQM